MTQSSIIPPETEGLASNNISPLLPSPAAYHAKSPHSIHFNCVWKTTGGKNTIHIGGFVPSAWKYTKQAGGKHATGPTERKFVQIASAYKAYLDADALGMSAPVNASAALPASNRRPY